MAAAEKLYSFFTGWKRRQSPDWDFGYPINTSKQDKSFVPEMVLYSTQQPVLISTECLEYHF